MKPLTIVLAASLALALTAPALVAQGHPLAGKWNVEYQRGVRNENGEMTPIMGTATLVLEQRADSLVGTLTPAGGDQAAPPPSQQFAAKADAGGATFVVKTQARLNLNGEVVMKDMTLTWTLTASGDTLGGTMLRTIQDAPFGAEPAPVKGTRTK